MKDVLSENAIQALYVEGFIRTGIHLPEPLINRICSLYNSMPASSTNWGYFQTSCLSNYTDIKNWDGFKTRLVRKYMPWRVHRHVRENIYDKAIFGSSEVLRPVLEECIHQELASYFGEIPLLVGHDIYLENSCHKTTFGFHHDSFGWEIFYQTGDDVSMYIALQDLNPQSGGRLHVERHANNTRQHKERNQYIRNFADYCYEHVGSNQRGLVTRESIIGSRKRKIMAREYMRLLGERHALPIPDMGKMRPIDAVRGEVILFNNKNFHAVETWKRKERRKNYIIRLFPLYDMRMEPPQTFLNKVPCNRFVFKAKQGKLENFDPVRDLIKFSEVP